MSKINELISAARAYAFSDVTETTIDAKFFRLKRALLALDAEEPTVPAKKVLLVWSDGVRVQLTLPEVSMAHPWKKFAEIPLESFYYNQEYKND